MLVFAGFVIGALFGVYRARQRDGHGFDVAQYAVTHAIIFALAGLLLTVILARLA